MTSDHQVSLRDFVDRILAENNLRRDDLRAEDRRWIELKFNALAGALELQAKEYERRLENLNHEHARAQEVLGTYIPRELYERAHQEVVEWQRRADVRNVEVDARIKSVELGLVNLPGGIKSLELGLASQSAQHLGSRMTTTTMLTIIGIIVVVAGLVIAILTYIK